MGLLGYCISAMCGIFSVTAVKCQHNTGSNCIELEWSKYKQLM